MYDVTYEEILGRMLSRVPDKLDKREGSVIFDAHSPAALELQRLYVELNTLIAESYADSASREPLIRRCKERGITPYEATKALLKGAFTPTTIDVTGKRFNIGAVNYTVLSKIKDGEYQVQCESPGAGGNQLLGAMIPIEYIDGLETAELTELLVPGEDEEDTEALRKRYFRSFNEKAFGGNVQDYLEKTNAIPGVGSTKVTGVWGGDIRPAELIPSAAVKSWYEGAIGKMSGEAATWLKSVYAAASEKKLTTSGTVLLTILNSDYNAASETLIQKVQNAIDPPKDAGEGYGLAPIGHMVSVKSAVEVAVAVTTNITFDTGYGWSNLQNAINEAVKGYLLDLRKAWAESTHIVVRISQIETRILGVKGVVDVGETKINGVEDNLALGNYEVPVFKGASA